MQTLQNKTDIAEKLEVPILIENILSGRIALDDATHYELHEKIADLPPDSALLCIALAASTLAEYADKKGPKTLEIMKLHAQSVLDEYGALWLHNTKENAQISDNLLFDILAHIPEDLESFTEFLEFCAEFTFANNETAAQLCHILHIQARAHGFVAETILEQALLSAQPVQAKPAITIPAKILYELGDNVIAFPEPF